MSKVATSTPSSRGRSHNTTAQSTRNSSAGREPGFFERMYNGEGGFQIVQNRKKWFSVMLVVVVICLGAIVFRGFALGIDFEGGTRISMPPSGNADETSVARVFEDATGVTPQSTQTVGTGDARQIEITSSRLTEEQIRQARSALFDNFKPVDATGKESEAAVNDSTVSESWGSSITKRMLIALGVFLLVVFTYITIRLERDMALAAIICLLIDLTVVSGIYALVGFEVSPATVIGLLTILSFSLYDTVVVFDKVKENTAGLFNSTRSTYVEQVNLAVNQTIMRSINTTIFSAVPIISLLVVAVGIMGVGTLKDLALVQFIGVIAGTFSSIFFAAPLLVVFKNRNPKYRRHDERVRKARASGAGNVSSSDATSSESSPAEDSQKVDAADSSRARTKLKRERKVVSPNNHIPGSGGENSRSWRPGM